MNSRETKRQEQRAQSGREELLERMSLALPNDGALEVLEGLFLARLTEPMESKLALYRTRSLLCRPRRQAGVGW